MGGVARTSGSADSVSAEDTSAFFRPGIGAEGLRGMAQRKASVIPENAKLFSRAL